MGLLGLTVLIVETVPSTAMTRTTLSVTEYRIREYVTDYERLPGHLSDLPPLEGSRDSRLTDAWDRPIRYTRDGSTVTLLSLGKDGRPGGSGADADVQLTFRVDLGASQPATAPRTRP